MNIRDEWIKAVDINKKADITISWEDFKEQTFEEVYYVEKEVRVLDVQDELLVKCQSVAVGKYGRMINASTGRDLKYAMRKYLSVVLGSSTEVYGVRNGLFVGCIADKDYAHKLDKIAEQIVVDSSKDRMTVY